MDRVVLMHSLNPTFILRSWLAQDAISLAQGKKADFSGVSTLLKMLQDPFNPLYSTFLSEQETTCSAAMESGGSGSGKKRAVDEAAENDPSHEEDGEEEIDEAEPEPENHEVEQEEGKELGAQTKASIRHSKSAKDSVDDIAGDESAEEAAEVKE